MGTTFARAAALWRRAAGPALAAAVLLWISAVLLSGGTLPGLALYLALFALGLVGSGCWLARMLLPTLGAAQRLVCAFPLGSLLLFGVYALVSCTPLPAGTAVWLCALPGLWEARRAVRALRAGRGGTLPPALAWGMALFLLLYTFYGLLPMALPERLRVWTYHQDFLWSIGNAASVRFGLPLQDMRVAGLPIHYHFLNDITAGLLAQGAGTTAWAGLAFYWYAPVGLLCLGALWLLARRLGAGRGGAALAVAGMFFMSGPQNDLWTNFYTNMNGMGSALLCLCAVLLLADRVQEGVQPAGYWPLLFGCGVAAALYKSTLGLLMACALLASWAVTLLWRRGLRWRGLAAGLTMLAAFGVCWALVFRFAVNNLVFTGAERLPTLPAAVAGASALGAALYLASLPYYLAHLPRLRLLEGAVNALALGGVLAFGLYTHYSASQSYFLLAAVPMWWAAAAPALSAYGQALSGKKRRAAQGALCAVCAAAMAVGLAGGAAPGCRRGVQAALRCMGLRTSPVEEQSILAGEAQAAAWLRDNTPAEAVFASNRNNRSAQAAEGVFHFFTAASMRRCYVESFRYAFDYTNCYHEIRRRLEQVSDAIYYRLPEQEAFALAAREGIDYLVVSRQVEDAPAWQREPVYANEAAAIYAVEG